MPFILISTTIRHTSVNQPSGRLIVFDASKRKIIKSCEIIEPPYRSVDTNPRGGFRGLKGISINQNRIAIANASTIFLYDHLWTPLNYLRHPSCAGIHDISLQGNLVWVTSSRNDLLLCLNLAGNITDAYDLRKYLPVQQLAHRNLHPFLSQEQIFKGKINFRDPRTHDNAYTDSLHVNSFERLENGDLLISCGLFRAAKDFRLHKLNNALKRTIFSDITPLLYRVFKQIITTSGIKSSDRVENTKKKSISMLLRVSTNGRVSSSLVLTDCTVPSHSVRELKNGSAIYLNTTSGEIIHFDPVNDHILETTSIGTKFLRGATQLSDNTLLLGDNNHIVHFDLHEKKVIAKTAVSENTSEAVFDITILPENFKLPPKSFIRLHEDILPVIQK